MKKQTVRIKSLSDLEKFVSDESISLENRLEVFTKTLDNYPLFVFVVKYDDTCTIIENKVDVLTGMLRTISEIKADPDQKTYRGFWVAYEHND